MNPLHFFVSGFALCAILLFGGCTRNYSARTIVVFGLAADPGTENALRAQLPPGDPSASVSAIRNTGLYEIRVHDADPQKAADRANQFVASAHAALSSPAVGKFLKIVERAEPPMKRS